MATTKRPMHAATADAEPNFRHKAYTEWLTTHTGYEADEKSVQIALSLANEFRKSPELVKAYEENGQAREAAKLDKRRAAAEKVRLRAEKLRAQMEALHAKADEIAPVDQVAAKRTAKVPAPAKKVATAKPAAVAAVTADDGDDF